MKYILLITFLVGCSGDAAYDNRKASELEQTIYAAKNYCSQISGADCQLSLTQCRRLNDNDTKYRCTSTYKSFTNSQGYTIPTVVPVECQYLVCEYGGKLMKCGDEILAAVHLVREYLLSQLVREPRDSIDEDWNDKVFVRLCEVVNLINHLSSNQDAASYRRIMESIEK